MLSLLQLFTVFSAKVLSFHIFSPCVKNTEQLQCLNLSGSKCTFDDLNLFEWKGMTELRYLNARSTFMADEVLHSIAIGCSNLTSLNLYGCSQIFHKAFQVRSIKFSLKGVQVFSHSSSNKQGMKQQNQANSSHCLGNF